MITIENAKVEILSAGEARPAGKSMIVVTIGDHVFDLTVDHKELIDALDSQLFSRREYEKFFKIS